jgi:monoamine oxidase
MNGVAAFVHRDRLHRIASSFNGRTRGSEPRYRGSNPWEATKFLSSSYRPHRILMSKSVLIVGAGAAGLACAADIAREGISVTVLEARDRVGGRILTKHVPGLPVAVELGAEFIHGKAQQIFGPMKQAGQEIVESKGDDWCREEGGLCACDFFEKVEQLLAKMKGFASPDRSFSDFLKQLPRGGVDEAIRLRSLEYVSGFNAADPAKIGVRSLLKDMERQKEIGGDHTFRLRNGYSGLIAWQQQQCARKGVDLRLEHVAERIDYRSDRVVVSGTSRKGRFELKANAVIVTVPVSLLDPEDKATITFDPVLPSAKLKAIRGTAFGPVMRVSLVFEQPFWKEMEGTDGRLLSNMRFLFSHDPFFPTWWTTQPLESPVLVAWSSGPRAEQFAGWGRDRIVRQVLASLSNILPIAKNKLESQLKGAFLHDWQADPFSRGAYSYLCVGAENAPAELARPVGNNLFFAGEATDINGDHATVHGAIESGHRAAHEVLATLKAVD